MTATTERASVAAEALEDEGTLVVEQHFAIVPEWVIDADVSDCAYRLYSVLLRYGQSSGQRMPGRALLASRLKKKSTDTVDRAMKELVEIGAVVVERRRRGQVNLTNRYHLVSKAPGRREPAPGVRHRPCTQGGRRSAATSVGGGSGTDAATRSDSSRGGRDAAATPGRTDAAMVAADLRLDPVVLTQEEPPPPSQPSPALPVRVAAKRGGGGMDVRGLLDACGIDDLDQLAARCQRQRRLLGQPATRWTPPRLLEVLHEAVVVRGWPASSAVTALMAVAADRETKSPMRLPCPGPWWELADRAQAGTSTDPADAAERQRLEARLAEVGGHRVALQRRARAELDAEGRPLSRLTVARRACELLDQGRTA